MCADYMWGQNDGEGQGAERRCLIVGAGLAGLAAAGRLRQHGWQAVVVEQARQVGGRLGTRRELCADGRTAVFDTGAQFFTVRSKQFRALVDGWLAAGIVREWSRGFAAADGSYYRDGHPRYCGAYGMDNIADYLATSVDVRLNSRVTSVRRNEKSWIVHIAGGESLYAPALILTAPAPQATALLRQGSYPLAPALEATLARLIFEPCLALMVTLAGPSLVPEPGGMWPAGDTIAWLADNQRKGISEVPALTIHGTPAFSQEYFDAEAAESAEMLLQAATDYVGADVTKVALERRRYSIPALVHPEPCLFEPGPPVLLFAGDAFAGPRVEGAVLSGLAAADRLLAVRH